MPARTGADYIAGLQDERNVWLNGERVEDVTVHPALHGNVQSIARLYDLQHLPELAEVLTYRPQPEAAPEGWSFCIPRSRADLEARRQMIYHWAATSGGLLGRSPDFLNSIVMALAAAAPVFASNDRRFPGHMTQYYDLCRHRDLCLTHALVHPQRDRSTTVPDPYFSVGIVHEDTSGMVVRGARMLATLGPIADEILVFPAPSRQQVADEQRYTLGFAVPVATAGLTLICRESYAPPSPTREYPLSARFDEMDAMAIFNDVFVPWERVFLKGDVQLGNTFIRDTYALNHMLHQVAIKNVAKLELLVGVGSLVAEITGRHQTLHIQEALGEIITYLETTKACIIASEAQVITTPDGVVHPEARPLHPIRLQFPRWYPRVVNLLRDLVGLDPACVPPARVYDSPVGAQLEQFYRAPLTPQADTSQVLHLARDLLMSAFGSREVLYERYFFGDALRNRAALYTSFDASHCTALVQRLLADQAE